MVRFLSFSFPFFQSAFDSTSPSSRVVETTLTLTRHTGLTMINMQSAFLIVSKGYTEKQAGVLFFGKLFDAVLTTGSAHQTIL